ncbi:protein Dok-7 [Xenentodon cancila]
MTDSVVAEGQVKFRDGKKWKNRSVVLQKPSPVADCLILHVYKGKKKGKSSGPTESLNVALEGICGVEPGPGYDGVSFTLSIICLAHTLVLGFSSQDALLTWDAHVRYSLGEVHRFSVTVEPGTKLESGPASLHLCNDMLALSRGRPPAVIGHWKLWALRRYGTVPNGFVFEGGTRCGTWAGVFFLSCSEGEQISFLFDCIVRGITPSRGLHLHDLHPNQPAGQKGDPASAEKRISQETSELEKRLSMLSQCSLASSTASHRPREEYQNPSLLKMWYNTPRTLLQSLSLREPSAQEASAGMDSESTENQAATQRQMINERKCELKTHHQAMMQCPFFWGSERAPFVDSEGVPIPSPFKYTQNLACGELQGTK